VGRRPLLVIAGWLGAAALALSVGLAATSVIGDELTPSAGDPISPAEADRQLAAAPAAAVPSSPTALPSSALPSEALPSEALPSEALPSGAPSASGDGVGVRKTVTTAGGTVIARCTGARVEILSMSPAQGYAVHERESGLDDSAEGEFRSTADNHVRVKVDVRCAAGTPTVGVRSEHG
jgi:hypothetical protein